MNFRDGIFKHITSNSKCAWEPSVKQNIMIFEQIHTHLFWLVFGGLATFAGGGGGGVVTFGGSLFSGFIRSHEVLTLLPG